MLWTYLGDSDQSLFFHFSKRFREEDNVGRVPMINEAQETRITDLVLAKNAIRQIQKGHHNFQEHLARQPVHTCLYSPSKHEACARGTLWEKASKKWRQWGHEYVDAVSREATVQLFSLRICHILRLDSISSLLPRPNRIHSLTRILTAVPHCAAPGSCNWSRPFLWREELIDVQLLCALYPCFSLCAWFSFCMALCLEISCTVSVSRSLSWWECVCCFSYICTCSCPSLHPQGWPSGFLPPCSWCLPLVLVVLSALHGYPVTKGFSYRIPHPWIQQVLQHAVASGARAGGHLANLDPQQHLHLLLLQPVYITQHTIKCRAEAPSWG